MINERELLDATVEKDTPLKHFIVDYVGNKLHENSQITNFNITVEMIIEVLTEDFPEIVLALAEENFLRGYEQGLGDQISLENLEINNGT